MTYDQLKSPHTFPQGETTIDEGEQSAEELLDETADLALDLFEELGHAVQKSNTVLHAYADLAGAYERLTGRVAGFFLLGVVVGVLVTRRGREPKHRSENRYA